MAKRNHAVPRDRRLVFRIGLNLGDVIVQDGDLYGDGVNIAARLETLAELGGICLSASAHEQVQDKFSEVRFEDLGEQRVKNIARPIRAYRVALDLAEPVSSPNPALSSWPSIAVLPLANLSADPEQEYFVDGLSEDLITDLSRIAGLLVIARNSTFTYKGCSVSVAHVGRELGVRYVVIGSVRKIGNRVRITAQLIDAATSTHVWADRYDRDLTDCFAVQDAVAREIANALRFRLAPDSGQRLCPARSYRTWSGVSLGRVAATGDRRQPKDRQPGSGRAVIFHHSGSPALRSPSDKMARSCGRRIGR